LVSRDKGFGGKERRDGGLPARYSSRTARVGEVHHLSNLLPHPPILKGNNSQSLVTVLWPPDQFCLGTPGAPNHKDKLLQLSQLSAFSCCTASKLKICVLKYIYIKILPKLLKVMKPNLNNLIIFAILQHSIFKTFLRCLGIKGTVSPD
jgi:hypothetical protein